MSEEASPLPPVFEQIAIKGGLLYTENAILLASLFRACEIRLVEGTEGLYEARVILAGIDPIVIFEGPEADARQAINDFVAELRKEGRLFQPRR
jgi:hypothetical protein